MHDTTCVLNKSKFSRLGGLICGHNLQDNILATETVCVTEHNVCTQQSHNNGNLLAPTQPIKIFVTEWAGARGRCISLFWLYYHTFWHWLLWPAISSCLQPVFVVVFGWKMPPDSLVLMPAPQYFFWEIGTHAFSNHIGHCGCIKVLFAELAKHVLLLRIDLKMVHLKNKNGTPLYRTLQTTQKCSKSSFLLIARWLPNMKKKKWPCVVVVFLVHSAASHLLAHFSSAVLTCSHNFEVGVVLGSVVNFVCLPFLADMLYASKKHLVPNMKMVVLVSQI